MAALRSLPGDRRCRSRAVQSPHQRGSETVMSGIYGIYRHDGASVAADWLEQMRSAMAFYGPDGGGSKVEGPLGMGHLLLKIASEDAYEQQPIEGSRGPVVSAARLDNREELLALFHISPGAAASTADGHLVSMAFDRWGG